MQRGRTYAVIDKIPILDTLPILVNAAEFESGGFATFLPEFRPATRVRQLHESEVDPNSKTGKRFFGAMKPDQLKHFLAVVTLMKAVVAQDALAVRKARENFIQAHQVRRKEQVNIGLVEGDPGSDSARFITRLLGLQEGEEEKALQIWNGFVPGPNAANDPGWLLSKEISDFMVSVRFVLWWTGRRFLPALYCDDLSKVLYVFAALRLAGGRGFAVCPKCQKPFIQKRSDQYTPPKSGLPTSVKRNFFRNYFLHACCFSN